MGIVPASEAINRTLVELKLYKFKALPVPAVAINRTLVELKRRRDY